MAPVRETAPAATPAGPPTAPSSSTIPAWAALIPVVALIALLVLVLVVLPRSTPGFSGSGHMPLVIAACIAAVVARAFGQNWATLEEGIVEATKLALPAVLIMLVIGMLMGTWIISGVVPALIDWGLALLSPSIFLPATCAVCSVVSVISGSSWSTAGTVGLALVGVGAAMDVNPAMTAGAVVSGAYFGDKLSPMSDTTNLAPAMAGTDLFTHIRHMLWTTVPAWALAMVLYSVMSLQAPPTTDAADLAAISEVIERHYRPGWWHLIPPILVFTLVLRRCPALPSLFGGVLLGAMLALVEGVPLTAILTAAVQGYVAATGSAEVDALLSRGGLFSMSDTLMLILAAMAFGGIMERSGMLGVLAARLLSVARSTASLVALTVLTAFGTNILAAEQYIAIVLPGRMFATTYRDRGLHPKNLSRAIEDGGTVTSPLVPWNTCGAFMAATLGVATLSYLPFAFLNLLTPLVSIFYAITGWTIAPAPGADEA